MSCGAFTSDGRTVVTTGDDQDPSLKVWNPRTGECTASVGGYNFHEAGITCLDITQDGLLSLTGSADGTTRLCHLATAQPTGLLAGPIPLLLCMIRTTARF